jgi:two-component system response regulator HydG
MARILVVDDDVAICDLLKKFLEKRNYEVSTALDGFEAMEKVRHEHPAVVLLDVDMPLKNGLDVLLEIKQCDKNIGVIMITAMKSEAVGRHALTKGAFDYILKPFDFDYLERALEWKLKFME